MIYDTFYQFWEFIFQGTTYSIGSQWLELLSIGCVLFVIWLCIFYPIYRLLKGRR